ncbi:pyruvate oxidase [Aneurinibacillus danicus]|uniref:Pyruvate oxidase n=1 Tax=Aneurinibacillus danicus TaxID=267746 RepID=A0A511V2E4_9BACL|nr:pyruvate oxidase [Aneurinibacillus danicus]GEN33049.1 pyruvate oxidase [Aneurinibacillus danicus]
MFRKNGADTLIDLLIEWGVDHVYGMPGDSINAIIEALRKRKDKIRFIQVRHEEAGALAAAAYAKLTGKLGVCLGVAGPGAIHLLNGLYDAKLDHAPVLAIAGQVDTAVMGLDYFQEVNLSRLFDDVAVYNQMVVSPVQLPAVVNQAIRTAYAEKGVAVLAFPGNVTNMEMNKGTPYTSPQIARGKVQPLDHDMDAVCAALNQMDKNIVILAGKGARGAREELLTLAEKLGAPIVLTLPAKGVIPDRHPYCLGGLGLLGTRAAYTAMQEADILFMIGTSYPFTVYLPERAFTIQLDVDARQIGKRYAVDVGIVGEAKSTLAQLNERVAYHESREFLARCKANMDKWWDKMESLEEAEHPKILPEYVARAMEEMAEENAVLSCDVGNVTVWAARHFRCTNQHFILSSWLATLGCGLPGAIAAQIAYPERQVFALCGDGGFGMMMADFVTAVKYDLPIIVVVFNNQKIAMIKFEQEVLGNLEYGTGLHNPNFAAYAEACGAMGLRVERKEDVLPALRKAAAAKRPCIIDVLVEADELPQPPNVMVEQAIGYAKHLAKELLEEGKVSLPPILRL